LHSLSSTFFYWQKFPQSFVVACLWYPEGVRTEAVSGIKHPAFREAQELTRPMARAQVGRYLLEDEALVLQALAHPACTLFSVFATPDVALRLEAPCMARRVPLYVLGGGLMQKLTGTNYENAVGAVAVVAQNLAPTPDVLLAPNALLLCGERIQDPRNVGVLIRTADAIGAQGLLLSADSAEPYSRQAMRSTTGSLLRLPICLTECLPEALIRYRTQGVTVIGSSGAATQDAATLDLTRRPLVLVVGNEQSGISDGVAAACDAVVRLPMGKSTFADSYNVTVAAGMLLYQAVRR
jgi:TrmH family RNA methyltransferase